MSITLRLTLTAILACMAMTSSLLAEVVTVGTAKNQNTINPYVNSWPYSTTQTIYTASEIGGAIDIEGIAYNVASTGKLQTSSVEIYMGHTTKSHFSSDSDYLPVSAMTLVYSGAPIIAAQKGWEMMPLSTPFAYNGSDNLVVMVCKKASSHTYAYYFYTPSSSQCLRRLSNNSSSYGDAAYTFGYSASSEKADIRFISNLFEYDGLRYVLTSDNEAMVIGSTNASSKLKIPSSVNYKGKEYSVTGIDDYAFYHNQNLTSIALPGSLTSIGDAAFYGCTSLEKVFNASTLKLTAGGSDNGYIAYYANKVYTGEYSEDENFVYVTSEGVRYVADYIGTRAHVLVPEGCNIDEYAFYNRLDITSITLPGSLSNIGKLAFFGCKNLFKVFNASSLYINTGNTTHGYVAYYAKKVYSGDFSEDEDFVYITSGDTKYAADYIGTSKDVVVPEGCEIAEHAFYNRSDITSITLPSSLKEIGLLAFYGCSGLTDITLPQSLTTIGPAAFAYCTALVHVSLPGDLANIDDETFAFCFGLSSITLPSCLISIGTNAFKDCRNLTKIVNNSPLQITAGSSTNGYVAYYAKKVYTGGFSEDENFIYQTRDGVKYAVEYIGSSKNVIVPANCEIDDYAFHNRPDLLTVDISSKVTSIGQQAFVGTRLKSLIIGSGVTTIAKDAFDTYSRPVKTIWLTNTPPSNYQTAAGSINYASNTNYSSLTGIIKVYKYLSSMFTVGGVKYAMNNTTECDAIDCVYNEEAAHISIGATVTYRNRQMNVKEVNPYACYGNQFIEEMDVCNQGNIGKYAFSGCTTLPAVTVSNQGYVGDYAFEGCTALRSAMLDNDGYVGESAFVECTNLAEIAFNNAGYIGKSCCYGCTGLKAALINNSGYVADYAFSECTALKTATLGDEVTELRQYAFSKCSSLEGISIPDGVVQIETHCFSDCSTLGYVHIGSGITTLNQYTFSGCNSLPEIIIPSTLNSIKDYVFKGCTHLADVILSDGDNTLTMATNGSKTPQFADCQLDSVYIGRKLSFSYSPFRDNASLRTLVIGGKEVTVYADEFRGCSDLTDAVLGDGLTTIGDNAFYECRMLRGIIIPNEVSALGNNSFQYCESLVYAVIGNKVPCIGTSTFSDCKSLVEISIPQAVTSVGMYSFAGCISLTNVIIEDRETNLSLSYNGSGKPLFSDCPLDSVYIGGKIIYNQTPDYGYSPFYRNLYLRSVVIADTETEVYDNEFYGCTNLTNVKIGDGVTKIGNWSFSDCSNLDYLAFGCGMQSIGTEAFSDCAHVTSIYSKATVPPVCGPQALEDINIWDCTLYVPIGTADDYAVADQWEAFFFAEEYDYDNEEGSRYYGDINRDGVIDIVDVILLQNAILGFPPSDYDPKIADIDHNKIIDEQDTKMLIDVVLGKTPPIEVSDDNHDIEI